MKQWLPKTIYKIEDSSSIEEIKDILIEIQNKFDFDFVLYGIHLYNSLKENFFISFGTYPAEWMKKYKEKNYAEIDPIYKHCVSSSIPIYWEKFYNDKNSIVSDFFADACSFGLCGGVSLGYKPVNGESGIFSLAKKSFIKEGSDIYCNAVLYMTALQPYIHNAIQKLSLEYNAKNKLFKLTKREVECLSWIAKGKTAGEVANILHVTESTIIFHLKNCIEKLVVSNRVQAIAKAIFMGIISPEDNDEPIYLTYNNMSILDKRA